MHLKGKSIVKENESILTKECQEFIDKENGIVITDKKQIFDELSKTKLTVNFIIEICLYSNAIHWKSILCPE